jgi:hypothetical protein
MGGNLIYSLMGWVRERYVETALEEHATLAFV